MSAAPRVRNGAPHPVLFAGIFVVAFATLLIELALMRVLSFTIWHHFGYVVISTALLGFGASGTLLALRPDIGTRDLRATLAWCSLLSAASTVGALFFISAVPLHPMSILDEPGQLVLLIVYQLVAAAPFFFGGLAVSLCLRAEAERVDRLYFWDLIGAGLGCVAAVVLMNWFTPPGAGFASAAAFAAAAVVFATGRGARITSAVLALALLVGMTFADRIPYRPARSKQLAIQLNAMGMTTVLTEWTALFRTDIVKTGRKTHRNFGLSRNAPDGLEGPTHFMAHDGTAGAGIFDLSEDYVLDSLDHHVLKLPYLVANPSPKVLVIGVGGGHDLIAAHQFEASQITGVELDPVTVDVLKNRMPEVSNGFFTQEHVRLVAGEGRAFIRSADEKYDLIQLTGVDTLSAVNSGVYVLAENYLYTVEAFHDYLDHLTPGGILSFAMGNLNPNEPRAAGRIVSVARQALLERGVERPEDHIAVVDSRALYAEVMIRTLPFTPEQVATLAEAAEPLAFQTLWLPGRAGHRVFSRLARAEGPARDAFLDGLRFKQTPTTDDNPFFLSFFRWTGLFEAGKLTPSHASALTQIVLLLLLVLLTILGSVLILLPLWAFGQRSGTGPLGPRIGVMIYFVALGLGFMLFEISLIQKFVLFLGYPTYSLSVTLCSLLISLGCGSYLSRHWVGRESTVLPIAVLAVAGFAAFYMKGFPIVQDQLLGTPIAVRAAVTAAVLFPLGLTLGIFFPLGIRIASSIHEDLVPWAWAINGCASVTAGVLAIVLAMTFGFSLVWALSVVIYALGVLALLMGIRGLRSAAGGALGTGAGSTGASG